MAPTGRPSGGFRQPGWETSEDVEAKVTPHVPWGNVRKRYLRDTFEPWMRKSEPRTKIITLRRSQPRKAGDLFGSHTTYWLLACPRCGNVAELDHVVVIMQDSISISPSVICPVKECGWRDVVQGWALKRD